MKRRSLLWICVCMLLLLGAGGETFLFGETVQAAAKPSVSSKAAYLWDITDNQVLYQKNGDTKYANASTTKLMTAILTLEKLKPTTVVTFSAHAAGTEPSKLWANAGESFYMRDLLYSLLVSSHNDTAVALAEKIAGSGQAFAVMMNQKAAAIGCRNTNFITPNGLDASVTGHGSSARDLALILNYGIRNTSFLDAIGTQSKTIRSTNTGRNFYLQTTLPEFYQMEGAIGGKTGYTNKAGQCFAGFFEKNGHRYIAVTLGAVTSSERWSDVARLMDYAKAQGEEEAKRSVTIKWDPVEDAQGYTVWYKLNGASAYTRAGITSKTSYTMNGLEPGVSYRFSVKPWVKEDGKYIFGKLCSQTDGTTKPEPARIASVEINQNRDVKVRLTGEAMGAQKYAMCYSTSSNYAGYNFKVGIRTSFTTRTMVKNLAPGTYYVRVRSYVELKDKTRIYASWSPAVKIEVA